MNSRRWQSVLLCLLVLVSRDPGAAASGQAQPSSAAMMKVFLDCSSCFQAFLREEVTFVEYVRDRADADVHVLITSAATGSGGREYTLAFIGLPPFEGLNHTLRTVTTSSDPEDVVRRQLANALRIGLLTYVTRTEVPRELGVTVRVDSPGGRLAGASDRWNKWVFSLRGSASFDGEESSRERQLGASVSADRVTPDWKITFGMEVDHEREEFDLDEESPVRVSRRERDFRWLVVKGLGQHWSIGAEGDIESSTFDNTRLAVAAAPAIEFNVFPYSMYTRRQLRARYSVGVQMARYYEETLFGKLDETLPQHQVALSFEQRERWGSLQAGTEWSQFLHDLDKTRLEAEGQVSVRVAQGLSLQGELSASRIRDQLSIPARGATAEEVLLRVRRLQSGYEYGLSVSLTYTFGSIFSSIVNPRFGE